MTTNNFAANHLNAINQTATYQTAINQTSSHLHDLSSFEPEAILSAMPGEHPRAAAALAIGRAASETDQLDVAALSQMVSELYAEGFPAGHPLASTGILTAIPATDGLAEARPPLMATGLGFTQGDEPNFTLKVPNNLVSERLVSGHFPPDNAPVLALFSHVQQAPNMGKQLELDALLGNLEAPYSNALSHLLGGLHAIDAKPTVATTAGFTDANAHFPTGSNLKANHHQPYYFLNAHQNTSAGSAFTPAAQPLFDVHLVRKDFPILSEQVNGKPLIWFDNAATTQKPQVVIDRLSHFYQHENSNIHRAAHALAARATDAYESARETVRRFIGASSVDNIVFVRGTTEAINLVAKTWGKKHIGQGDEILISHLEHHANIVPWQQLCQETGAKLKVAPVDESGQIILSEYQQLITAKTKLVAFTQVSNALGTVTPAKEMIEIAHRAGAKVLLDGAQSVSHMHTDVLALGCDFFVFSGHKVFGPTGIGVLYGTTAVLEDMPVWQGGGNMIQDVTFEKTLYHKAPAKFEAGTSNIADAVGLGAALEYVARIGLDNIARYEHALLVYATAALCKVPSLRLIGTAKNKASVLSFSLNGYQSEEVGAALNAEGIAVRSGHHCAQPILRRFGVETTVRPSLAFYNTYAEVDAMVAVLQKLSTHHR